MSNYEELSNEIGEICQLFIEEPLEIDKRYEPQFKAFNSNCSAHILCHLASLKSGECHALQLAFIMGIHFERTKTLKKEQLQDLYNMYNEDLPE